MNCGIMSPNPPIPQPSGDDALSIIYGRLLDAYGPQGWWPADSQFEMIAGAILTQSAAWRNVELALANLKAAGIADWPEVHHCDTAALAQIIRPSGYYNMKARKLKAFAARVCEVYGGSLSRMFANPDTAALRRELLDIYGIGPETADDILLYAAGRPSFVIDAYTIRIMQRIGIAPDPDRRADYAAWQALFHAALPPDADRFNEYHALLDWHHKAACRKNSPLCNDCCLNDICDYARRRDAAV